MVGILMAGYLAVSVAIPVVWDLRHPPKARRAAVTTGSDGTMRRR